MANPFDPYYHWLGIPPADQPPNYYRLLCLPPFEPKPEVIEAAANRQIDYLGGCQPGPGGESPVKLLAEVAAARQCLLNPQSRAVYDEELRRRLGGGPPKPPKFFAAPTAPPVTATEFPGGDTESKVIVLEQADGDASPSPESLKKRREAQRLALVGILCAGLVLVAAAMVWKTNQNKTHEPEMTIVPRERRLVDVKDAAATGKGDGGVTEASDANSPAPKSVEGGPGDHGQTPNTPAPPPQPVSGPDAGQNVPAPEQPTPGSDVGTPAIPGADVVKRLAVPSSDEQAAVAKLLAGLYPLGKDAAAADKVKLANGLLGQADRAGVTAAERFVLLRKASDLACEAGAMALMLQPLDVIGVEYEVDLWKVKEKYLLKFGENSTDPVRLASLVDASKRFIADASAEEKFESAASVALMVNQACQRSNGKAYRKETLERLQRIQHLQAEYAGVREALAAMETTPDDPDLNLKAGRWYAIACGKWDKGLPYLAKGGDDDLAKAARREVAHANTPEDEVKVGDAWWDLAETSQGEDRDMILRHAGEWYQKNQRNFTSGFTRIKIDKRLADIAKATGEGSGELAGGNAAVPLNQWIDLLGRVDLERDSAAGQWKRVGEAISAAKGDFARLSLPVKIPRGNYDIEVELIREDGNDAVAVILPLVPRQCAFVLNAGGGAANGLELVSGMPATHAKNLTASRPGSLVNNRSARVLIKVRRDNDNVRIDVVLNNKGYPPAGGFLKELSLPSEWWTADPQRPVIGVHQCAVTFRRVRLRLLSGEAALVTGKGAGSGLPAADSNF